MSDFLPSDPVEWFAIAALCGAGMFLLMLAILTPRADKPAKPETAFQTHQHHLRTFLKHESSLGMFTGHGTSLEDARAAMRFFAYMDEPTGATDEQA